MSKETEPQSQPDETTARDETGRTETVPPPSDPTGPLRTSAGLRQQAVDRRQFSVFQVDEFIFQPTPTRTAHWAVPWSDLMMTLFILFLIMFAYQTSNTQLAVSDRTEVIGGQTTDATVEMSPNGAATVPFAPIKQGLPFITAGTIKKVVPVHVYSLEPNLNLVENDKEKPMDRIAKSAAAPPEPEVKKPVRGAGAGQSDNVPNDQAENPARNGRPETPDSLMQTIAATIARYNLGKYASVDIDSGSDVRITLSSDVFFTAGKAELSSNSMSALQKIGAAIKETPFVIQVVGYTDNLPSTSERYPSNWELSSARASSITRFFIEETDMNPNQFIASGYASYHPLYPNTTLQNRAANRRIEVIITQQRPRAAATSTNQ